MTFHFCGYFPKKLTPRPEGYDLPGVVDIASISNCIAEGPADWIKSWTFNDLGFFDDVDTAESLVPGSDRSQFAVYAYDLLDERFEGGIAEPCTVPPAGLQTSRQRLRVSRVRRSQQVHRGLLRMQSAFLQRCSEDLQGECALPVRRARRCRSCCQVFSKGSCEPGPYYVARVLRRAADG